MPRPAPRGFITGAAEPEEYDVDEAEADPVVTVSDHANLAGGRSTATNVEEVLDQLDRELIALAPSRRGSARSRRCS